MTAWFGWKRAEARAPAENEVMDVVFGVLRRAGYNMDDLTEKTLGMLAFRATLDLEEGGNRPRPSGATKVGRNDPCPCGRGRKFKKCCEGKEDAKAPAPHREAFGVLRDPSLLPRLHDVGAMQEDFSVLAGLWRSDPELRKVRFSPRRVYEFLRTAGREVDEGIRPVPDNRDDLAARYLQEVEGPNVLGDVRAALVNAAGRHRGNPSALRALATGLATHDMDAAAPPGPEGVSPLMATIFWATAGGWAEAEDQVSLVIDRLGGREELARRLEAGDFPGREELEQAVEGLDVEAAAPLTDHTREWLDRFRQRIREGEFSVGLPGASVLPFCVHATRLEQGGGAATEALLKLLAAQAAALEPEDLTLYDRCLEDWLGEEEARRDPESRQGAFFLRGQIAADSLAPFDFDLLVAWALHGQCTLLPDEEPFWEEDFRSVAWLERYGDFLLERGFPALARRTWRLCEEFGALPTSVAAKLR